MGAEEHSVSVRDTAAEAVSGAEEGGGRVVRDVEADAEVDEEDNNEDEAD